MTRPVSILPRSVVLLFSALLSSTSHALDLQITGVSCDNSLPISSTFFMSCGGYEQCAFGSVVDINGIISYNGLANTDIVNNNNLAYISGTLYAPTDTPIYDFANDFELDMCSEDYFLPMDDNIECPASGNYAYQTSTTLPDSEYLDDFWASGWSSYATLIFADQASDEDGNVVGNILGDCRIDFHTFSTEGSASSNPIRQMATGKSAAVLMLVLIAALALCACYCCFCCQKKNTDKDVATASETEFTRMQDKPTITEEARPEPSTTPPGEPQKSGPAWTSI